MREIRPTYIDYCKFIFYIRRWQLLKWIIIAIIPIMMLFVLYNIPHNGEALLLFHELFIVFIFEFFLIITWILFNLYHSHLAHHRAKKEGHIPFKFQANENGIIIEEQTIKSEIKWEKFKKIVETKSMLLFLYGKNNVMWLPKNKLIRISEIKKTIASSFNGKVVLLKQEY